MKKLIIGICLVCSSLSVQAESDLTKKLDSINIPTDKVSPLISKRNLYAVNSRYSTLNKRHELTINGANNFNADSHLETKQVGGSYRFHINSKWSLGYKYSEYKNQLSASGKKLFENKQILPDSDFAIKSTEGFINYNTVYGKLRLTKSQIVYFDQYISLGYGDIDLARGNTQVYNVDLGFAFWLGRNFSTRVGVKNEMYRQANLNDSRNVHHAMGYIEFGYLFGGRRI